MQQVNTRMQSRIVRSARGPALFMPRHVIPVLPTISRPPKRAPLAPLPLARARAALASRHRSLCRVSAAAHVCRRPFEVLQRLQPVAPNRGKTVRRNAMN